MRLSSTLTFILLSLAVHAQTENDSTRLLQEIIVKAFAYNRPIDLIPASVDVVDSLSFNRFANTSLVSAFNTLPGVRMEERSPGSYRLSIRGSTLRSPFGIRNVKVYWNDLPFTDPGGNTYLNLLDFSMVQQAEVIKGPGSSLYGAGTGGVLLLRTPLNDDREFNISTTTGSYGLRRLQIGAKLSSNGSNTSANYFHQQSDGYRDQTRMTRDVVQAQASFRVNEKRTLTGSIFYTDLYYQTPGGLTKSESETNPRQARPAAGPNPGAEEQKAAVNNKTFFAGITHDVQVNDRWSNLLAVYAAITQFKNPSIRNYERRSEQGFGARSVSQYHYKQLSINVGGEFQYGFSPIHVYDNNQGQIGALQTNDEIRSTTYLLFVQAEWAFPRNYFLTLGASGNGFAIRFDRFSTLPVISASRNFSWQISPRIAFLKKIHTSASVYASISRGFSPPTVAELFPSSAVFDKNLEPEVGTNYEAGVKGNMFTNTFRYQLAVYTFRLDQTIVVRRNEDDADYFVNAGKTHQRGVELSLAWKPMTNITSPVIDMQLWSTLTLTHYVFSDYVQNTSDYSGNKLTGVPDQVVTAGVDFIARQGFYIKATMNHTGRLPLNDANTDFAEAYTLIGSKVGYQPNLQRSLSFDIFVGADNLLDQRYSLGNDLNAFGGRYFNPAPGRNFYAGLSMKYKLKRKPTTDDF